MWQAQDICILPWSVQGRGQALWQVTRHLFTLWSEMKMSSLAHDHTVAWHACDLEGLSCLKLVAPSYSKISVMLIVSKRFLTNRLESCYVQHWRSPDIGAVFRKVLKSCAWWRQHSKEIFQGRQQKQIVINHLVYLRHHWSEVQTWAPQKLTATPQEYYYYTHSRYMEIILPVSTMPENKQDAALWDLLLLMQDDPHMFHPIPLPILSLIVLVSLSSLMVTLLVGLRLLNPMDVSQNTVLQSTVSSKQKIQETMSATIYWTLLWWQSVIEARLWTSRSLLLTIVRKCMTQQVTCKAFWVDLIDQEWATLSFFSWQSRFLYQLNLQVETIESNLFVFNIPALSMIRSGTVARYILLWSK